jgi:hypothetical protein
VTVRRHLRPHRQKGIPAMTLRRGLTAALATTFLAVVMVGAATAAKPTRVPLVIEDEVLTGFCPFPVLLEITANKEFVTFFDDGRILVTGKLFVRLTNVDEPSNVLDLNISGPAHITPLTERSAGRGLFVLFPEDVGGPGLVLTTGRVDIVRGEDGFFTDFTVRGTTVDVCAALA